MERLVYKVCPRKAWQEASRSGAFQGSLDDRRDGFVHLSTAEQLPQTLAKHFPDQTDLVLSEFASAELGASLRWEPSRGGAHFPHLYGPLPTALARRVVDLPIGLDGTHQLPEELT